MNKKTFKLEAEKVLSEAKADIIQLKELTKPIAPENAIGRISRMDAINNKSVNEAALRALVIKVKNIEVALKSIDNPDFDICKKCKKTIPEGRLLILPGTSLCVNCA